MFAHDHWLEKPRKFKEEKEMETKKKVIMRKKKWIDQRIVSIILTLVIAASTILVMPTTVHAAGWPDYAQNLTLGTAVYGSIKEGDYNGLLENEIGRGGYFWNVYKFSMPKNGLLNIYLESENAGYFFGDSYSNYYYDGFAIFSCANPDNLIWRSYHGENILSRNYSSGRALYYGSTEIALDQGEYYFTVRQKSTNDTPYCLTLSYKEPNVNVTSISLDKKNLQLEPGEQEKINAAILPDNATDKTVIWESSEPNVAVADNGTVTAKNAGTTTITASSADGEITTSCQVTVVDVSLIDAFEEAKPTITSITSSRKKAAVYFSSINSYGVKYQVAYKTGSGKWKIKNTASTSATIRNLKSKKTYSVRVRGYKQFYEKTYYSSWSETKKVKAK